jgi:uncharacterized protein YcfJ
MMRSLAIAMYVLAIPCASWAQSSQASWENLSTLLAGQKIQVVEMNSKEDFGTFLNASATAISLRETAGEQTIQRQDVRSVKLMEHAHRLRNTLIGAAVGAGAGAGITAAAWETHGFFEGRKVGAVFGAVLGVIGGAIIGALWPSHKMIYRVKAH